MSRPETIEPRMTEAGSGFLIGAGAMALGGVAELFWGVRAEGQSLEAIAATRTTSATASARASGVPAGIAPRCRTPSPEAACAACRAAATARPRPVEAHARCAAPGRAYCISDDLRGTVDR
jgi:hypothetical protein